MTSALSTVQTAETVTITVTPMNAGDFRGDRDAAAGQRQHDHVGAMCECSQFVGELTAGVRPIQEAHDATLLEGATHMPAFRPSSAFALSASGLRRDSPP